MIGPTNRKDFATVYINKNSIPAMYDNSKVKRKQSCWRYWNRLSSLQRSVACIVIIAATIFGIYVIPNMYHNFLSVEELDDMSRRKQSDNVPVAPHGPPLDQKKFAESAISDIRQKAKDELVRQQQDKQDSQLVPPKRGPPQLLDRKEQQADKNPENLGDSVDHMANIPAPAVGNIPLAAGAMTFTGPTNDKQKAVINAFKHSWTAYKKYAWGHDHLKPVTKTFEDWFGVGLTLIDALDTMYIMGLKDEFAEAREWVQANLSFDVNKDVNLFECTIRVLGGLLSTYHLSGDQLFLEKAKDVADRMMPAFGSGSPIPFSDVNLKSGKAHAPRWGPDSSTAEVTTIQLEYIDLSHATGESKYKEAVNRVTEHVHKQPKKDGLVPIFINAQTGRFRSSGTITLGARGDSYYEYLLKMWIQSGKTNDMVKEDYLQSVEGMKKHLLSRSKPSELLYFGELLGGHTFSPKMDHLVCFLGGSLAMGAHNGLPEDHLNLGKELTKTCTEMYFQMATGLSPEITYFNTAPGGKEDLIVKPADTHNLERPETVESLFYLYRITGDYMYREWGWRIFQSFEKHTRLPEGYSAINNVKAPLSPGVRNKMESFWLGETLKYFYLLFDDSNLIPLDEFVFNTEAHPLPILKR